MKRMFTSLMDTKDGTSGMIGIGSLLEESQLFPILSDQMLGPVISMRDTCLGNYTSFKTGC